MACLAGILAGSAAVAGEGVDVTYAGGLLTVRCADAELAEVLEQIGTATGMSLVLDEAVKSTSLTADIEAQPVQLALERLLEGRGVTYAMSLSADGQKVAQMYVGTDAEARNAASAGAPRLRAPAVPVPAAHRTPEPAGLPAFHAPAPAPVPDEDDDADADLGDDASAFAGLSSEAVPGLPATALPAGEAMSTQGRGAPVVDPFARPIPMPQGTPAAPAEQKPASPVNQ